MEALLNDLALIGIHVKLRAEIPKMIQEIQQKADDLGLREEVDKLIIKSQKKAIYEPENKGHFGLGFDMYTHFTSPIRRYSDLTLHRLLKAKIAHDEKKLAFIERYWSIVWKNQRVREKVIKSHGIIWIARICTVYGVTCRR